MSNRSIPLIVNMLMLSWSAAFAKRPLENVNLKWQANITAAQRLSRDTYKKIVTDRQANERNMVGHAQKA